MVSQQPGTGHFRGHDGRVHSDQILMQFGTHECAKFRQNLLSAHDPLAGAIKAEYLHVAQSSTYVEANLRLLSIHNALHVKDFYYLSDHEQVSQFALELANICTAISVKLPLKKAYKRCADKASSYKLTPPDPEDYSNNIQPCLNRLCCEHWWKRNLMRLKKTSVEAVARDLKLVHNHAAPYCSTISLNQHRAQKKANRDFLESQLAVNELEQEYTLAQLSDLSVSNPSIRRLELITRCKGYETLAKEQNHEALFITLTSPSRFHRMTKITNRDGKVIKVIPNKNYDGSTPRDTQKYLRSTWAKIQAKLNRENIRPYGFRVAEPHHDGTPHWHFLLFIDKGNAESLLSIFMKWGLKDSPDEKGAQEHRVKVEQIKSGINPATGREYSATGYIIKYISKNVDGNGIDNSEPAAHGKDWHKKDPYETAERIEAWARTNRIRQFQPIGGPSVTVWREFRRLSEQEGIAEKIRQAADSGDWAAFVRLMGGTSIPRKDYLARPTYALSENLDYETGEISPVTHTRYGDEARERVVGVLISGMNILSRTHFWTIKENERVVNARQKIMDGIADILEEIHDQNQLLTDSLHSGILRQAKPDALDLFQ